MSVEIITPGLPKIKDFWNISYDIIIFVRDATNDILSCDSNYIVDVVMFEILHQCGKRVKSKSQKVLSANF